LKNSGAAVPQLRAKSSGIAPSYRFVILEKGLAAVLKPSGSRALVTILLREALDPVDDSERSPPNGPPQDQSVQHSILQAHGLVERLELQDGRRFGTT
jgi:hypothetical protein